MILLTDEEIQVIILRYKNSPQSNFASGRNELAEIIAKAQLKNVVRWGIEPCFEHSRDGGVFTRRECPKCWQALLEEVKR